MTKTEKMMWDYRANNVLSCPVDNQYQGPARRMLFVCTAGLLRSPTGANVATKLGFNARSCGSSVRMALIPISVNLVYWAQHIFFMNSGNRDEARIALADDDSACDLMKRKAIVLDIEDDFDYMADGLVQQFQKILNDTKFVD